VLPLPLADTAEDLLRRDNAAIAAFFQNRMPR
jgi:hypothetical protein